MSQRLQSFRGTAPENDAAVGSKYVTLASLVTAARINGSIDLTLRIWSTSAIRLVGFATTGTDAENQFSADKYYHLAANTPIILKNVDPNKFWVGSADATNRTCYGSVTL